MQIKATKGGKSLVEIVVTEGVVVIRCRECLRYHRIRVASVLHNDDSMMDLR